MVCERCASLRTPYAKENAALLRVCYAYFERFAAIVLIMVYPKNAKADLSAAEKKAAKELIRRVELDFEKRLVR